MIGAAVLTVVAILAAAACAFIMVVSMRQGITFRDLWYAGLEFSCMVAAGAYAAHEWTKVLSQ